ncbi:hypothetical protein E4O93_16435 [Diaphorobacter sp. DS2]|nr:hypothetical protein E4O93_16435 [Diaphorobacter sp. DS2]
MAKKKGQYAKITLELDGVEVDVMHLRNWEYSASVEEVDATAAGSDWMEYLPSFKSWEGSAETIDVDTFYMEHLGEITTIKFYEHAEDSQYEEGQVFISGVDKSAAYDDLIEQSLSFRGTGPLERKPKI